MTIQWFPGHMTKAKRLITTLLPKVDVVIELRDARVPSASQNPLIDEIIGEVPRVIVFNKADLADPKVTRTWLKEFQSGTTDAVEVDALAGRGVPALMNRSADLVARIRKERGQRTLERAARAMIVGIPNVGKSSLINRMAQKKVARTGDQPAVTRKEQWVRLSPKLHLLDTPGMLWHKFEDQEIGKALAACGCIKEAILNPVEIAEFIIEILDARYPEAVNRRFKLKDNDRSNIVETIGRKRGCLISGGGVDLTKAAGIICREFRGGQLGRVSLETPLERIHAPEDESLDNGDALPLTSNESD